MQVDDIRAIFADKDPLCRSGTIECECVRVAGERASCIILVVDSAAAVLRKQSVIKYDVLHATVVNRDAPDIHCLRVTTKVDVDCRKVDRTGQLVQRAIRWRRDRNMKARRCQRTGQVSRNVTDAANLAAGQGAVLGC
jgi:hypothetical protein